MFWHLTPKTIKPYFEAEKIRQKKQDEFAWLIGAYVQRALACTPLTAVAALAEKLNLQKMPKYPEKPFASEVADKKDIPLTEEQKHYESMRMFEMLKRFGGDTRGVRFNK